MLEDDTSLPEGSMKVVDAKAKAGAKVDAKDDSTVNLTLDLLMEVSFPPQPTRSAARAAANEQRVERLNI